MKPPTPRNPVAHTLRTPQFKLRIVRSAKTYRRKGRNARRAAAAE